MIIMIVVIIYLISLKSSINLNLIIETHYHVKRIYLVPLLSRNTNNQKMHGERGLPKLRP